MPTPCIASRYNDIIAITALDDGDVKWSLPFNSKAAQSPFIQKGTHYTGNLITEATVVCDPQTTQLTVSPKNTTAGTLYTNTLSFSIEYDEDSISAINGAINKMQSPKHILLTFAGGSQALIRLCDKVGYNFARAEEDGEIKCNLTIANLSGMQRISL